MKRLIEVCVVGVLAGCVACAQEAPRPELRKGVSVQMATAEHAVEMRGADEANSSVVAITAGGKVYAGIEAVEPGALGKLSTETVYVKADARVPYQTVLAVLDALRGKTVVLLAASPANTERAKFVPPYGIKVIVAR